jgi:hypothetical protein
MSFIKNCGNRKRERVISKLTTRKSLEMKLNDMTNLLMGLYYFSRYSLEKTLRNAFCKWKTFSLGDEKLTMEMLSEWRKLKTLIALGKL